MKKLEDKKVVAVIFAISALIITIIAVHGCGVLSYEGKKVTSLSLDPVHNTTVAGTVTIAAQTVQQFKATGHYSDSTTTDLSPSVTWSTSDPLVATVSATGLATAVATSGTCTITATGQGMTGTTKLTIANVTLQSITVSPGTVSTNKGLSQQFAAAGVFSDGTATISQDITTLVSWSSSTTSVATINAQGLATGVSAGTTNITAQWNGITSPAATLTVSNEALTSIAITAPAPSVKEGNTLQLTATGTFADNTTQDMTSQVTWNSANPDVATVDSSGLVTGVVAGRATITGTAGGITGSIQLTVLHVGH